MDASSFMPWMAQNQQPNSAGAAPGTTAVPQQQANAANPSQFYTPLQIAAQRQYAANLMNSKIPTGTSGNVTAVSPWGGAAQMASAGLGAGLMGNAGLAEKLSMLNGARNAPQWQAGAQNGSTPYLNGSALFSPPPTAS